MRNYPKYSNKNSLVHTAHLQTSFKILSLKNCCSFSLQ